MIKYKKEGKIKIAVVGLGYVGTSNAVLLAQNNQVVGVDVCEKRVAAINNRISPIQDIEIS
jgi:UDPglucose 6-dehydrogenase